MAFTSSDQTLVETAIRDLVLGKKRMVEFAMPDGRIERYTDVKLPELREFLKEIKEEIGLTSGTRASRILLTRHSNGL